MGDRLDLTPPEPKLSPDRVTALHRLAEILERSGIDLADLDDVGRIDKIEGGTWETAIKLRDAETGEERIETVRQERAGWVVSPSWDTGPQWPLIQPGPTFDVSYREPSGTGSIPEGWRTLVCLPDIQAPFQDERAMDVALEIVARVSPDAVVLHGDNLDLAELSRFRQHPSFAGGAQAAIDRMTLFCAELRAAAGPDAEIVWIEGNHEARLEHYVLDNAASAFGLSRGKLPDEDPQRPVLSVAELCRLTESGVTYLEGYPANPYWFQPNVRVVHGHYTGQNAHSKYLAEGVTTVWGHTHSRMWADKVLADGRRIYGLSPGCLCDVNGSVPGTMTGYGEDGPKRQPVNWDQGVLIGYGNGTDFRPEMVPIVDGRAVFRGELIAP